MNFESLMTVQISGTSLISLSAYRYSTTSGTFIQEERLPDGILQFLPEESTIWSTSGVGFVKNVSGLVIHTF